MNRFFHALALIGALATCLLITTESRAADSPDVRPGMNAETFSGLEWRGIGPALMLSLIHI